MGGGVVDPATLRRQLVNAVTLAAKQDTVVWAVFSVFVAAAAGLFVALFQDGVPSKAAGIVFCVTGLLTGLVSVAILTRALDYFDEYERRGQALERALEIRPQFSVFFRVPGSSTRKMMIACTWVVASLWGFGLVVFTFFGTTR
jgi:high-affinity Fe2+/Pb2+ permease